MPRFGFDRWPRATLTGLVFLAILAASLYSWGKIQTSVYDDFKSAYTVETVTATSKLSRQFQTYKNVLRGGVSLFQIASDVSEADWARYYQAYNLSSEYPETAELGYAPIGQQSVNVGSASARPNYAPITLLANYKTNHANLLGYNLMQTPAVRQLLLAAQVSGKSVVYPKLNLPGEHLPLGFMIYVPVYSRANPATVAERRSDLRGYVFMAIDSRVAFAQVLSATNPNFGVSVSASGQNSPAEVLYQTAYFAQLRAQSGALSTSQAGAFDQPNWHLNFAATPALISASERQAPLEELLRGIFTSLFFASLVWYLIGRREQRAAQLQLQIIQSAKDDLLSLASHQLRTPATIVKQYVGMLLEGYAGELSPEQKAMLSGAYESNERQLEIINQLLYVARLDAGQIKIHKNIINLNKLLKDVIQTQTSTFEERRQKLTTNLPRKHIHLPADASYLPMVFENLLSNAGKYTPADGTISLRAYATQDAVIVEVGDSGIGIPAADLATIFDKFTRVENASEVSGSGIGLYLTMEIVKLHGGSITVQSRPDQGSTFRVCLPLGDENPNQPAEQTKPVT